MSTNKNALRRYHIIDELLSKGNCSRRVKTKVICQEIERRIGLEVKPRTVNKDMEYMALPWNQGGFGAPIEKDTKEKAYYYADYQFSIQKFPLPLEQVKALYLYSETLNTFKNVKVFQPFHTAINTVLAIVNFAATPYYEQEVHPVVLTDEAKAFSGTEFLPIIVEAIQNRQTLKFNYQKHSDDQPKEVFLEPYLLKESLKYWYVIGKRFSKSANDRITQTFAIDRITELTIAEELFVRESFDPTEHFKGCYGISTNEEPEKVILAFTENQAKYVRTIPLHESQQEIEFGNTNEAFFSYYVRPTYEWIERILGYGELVRVVEPPSLKDKIKGRLLAALDKY